MHPVPIKVFVKSKTTHSPSPTDANLLDDFPVYTSISNV